MLTQGLKKGFRAAERVFDKKDHLNRPGMQGIKTAYKTYKFFEAAASGMTEFENLDDL